MIAAPDSPPVPSLWRHADFRKLWAAQTVSQFGSRITREGLPLAANLVLGVGPGPMSLLATAGLVPVLLVSLFAGVWVDRLRRRPLLIAADLGRAALLLSIPVAAVLGALRIEQLYVVAALAGVLTVIFDVADQSYLPTLVGRTQIMEGNSKLATTESLAEVVGPALAGGLVQAITAPFAILFDALSFVVSAGCLSLIRQPEPPPPPATERTPILTDIRLGLRLILGDRLLRPLTLAEATRSLCGGAYATLYSLFVVRELQVPPILYGVLVTMGGVGSLVGASLVTRLTRRLGLGPTLTGATLLIGLVAPLTPLAAGSPQLVVIALLLGQLVGDCAHTVLGINEVSLRQTLVPDALLGRANASARFLTGALVPFGALAAGWLADPSRLGMRGTLLLAATGILLASGWVVFSAVPRLRALPQPGE